MKFLHASYFGEFCKLIDFAKITCTKTFELNELTDLNSKNYEVKMQYNFQALVLCALLLFAPYSEIIHVPVHSTGTNCLLQHWLLNLATDLSLWYC